MYEKVGFRDLIRRARDLIFDGRRWQRSKNWRIYSGCWRLEEKDDVLVKIGCKIKAGGGYIYFGWFYGES